MTVPPECKRLVEVDFPIATVSREAVREKNIRFGHPSTLHLWWARRPMAACRAMILALLLPDPADPKCPAEFTKKARAILPRTLSGIGSTEADLRAALLDFIGDFSNWDNANDEKYLAVARGLVKAAYADEPPLVTDPFSGGGSIPAEALRVGCEAFASDLNPVACLILKTMLEDIPEHGKALVEELRRVGPEIKAAAQKDLAGFYPHEGGGITPVAYLWARTVQCETPGCGAEIPIFRSPWLSKKGAKKARYFKESVDGNCWALLVDKAPKGGPLVLRVARGHGSEKPGKDYVRLSGTKAPGNNANAICPCCKTLLPGNKKNPRVPTQLARQRGGADVQFDETGKRAGGATLFAVAVLKDGKRIFRDPDAKDYQAVWKAQQALRLREDERLESGLSVVPDEPLPPPGTLGFRVQRYGMKRWRDLFTSRQLLALTTLRDCISAHEGVSDEGREVLGLALSRFADICNASCRWENTKTQVRNLFTRQALPIIWDFAEPSLFGEQAGDYAVTLDTMIRVIDSMQRLTAKGRVNLADATQSPLPDESVDVWFTDPPYYDAIPYADLSDFFYVWLRRVLPGHPLMQDPFDRTNPLTPKRQEAVQDETKDLGGSVKDKKFFEQTMSMAFGQGRRVLKPDGVACVVFAHKSTDGWEALLSGMVGNGWVITASWPVATESGTRLRAKESAALATSVHLVCRPRSPGAPIGEWSEVARELPLRVRRWMDRLSEEGVRGADLVFACIGPAMEVYSQYQKVVDAQDRVIPLGPDPAVEEPKEPHEQGYLAKVWEVVGRLALESVLMDPEGAGTLEEDARLTAIFLWALESSLNGQQEDAVDQDEDERDDDEDENDVEDDEGGGNAPKKKGLFLVHDVVRRFAQPLGIRLEAWEGRVIETKKGVVRLLPVAERADQLFGKGGVEQASEEMDPNRPGGIQLTLFPDEAPPAASPKRRGKTRTRVAVSDETAAEAVRSATTLDRVHGAMLLQASGKTNALRSLLAEEKKRGGDFERLANALSRLYPKGTDERRLVEGMLLAMPK